MQVDSKLLPMLHMQSEQALTFQLITLNYNTIHLTGHCKHIDSCNCKIWSLWYYDTLKLCYERLTWWHVLRIELTCEHWSGAKLLESA